jgi:hypothetical protein
MSGTLSTNGNVTLQLEISVGDPTSSGCRRTSGDGIFRGTLTQGAVIIQESDTAACTSGSSSVLATRSTTMHMTKG